MRRMWDGLGFIFATLFLIAGCAGTETLKPPKRPECYELPPKSEVRFSQPPCPPRKYLMQDLPRMEADPSSPNAPLRRQSMGGASRGF